MTSPTRPGAAHVYDALLDAGVGLLVGLPGTQTVPLDRVVAARDEMRYVMARHETAVPHVAWGHYEVSGVPAATLTVPGPGETNAMHGLKNALNDSVPILHVTGDAHPDDRGKGPIHEIEPDTYDNVVKENVVVESPRDLPAAVERGVERALTPPMGPVRLGVPSAFLANEVAAPAASVDPERVTRENGDHYDAAAALLAEARRPLVWVGGGAVRSPGGTAAVRALVDELDAPAVTTYKSKGAVPEDDPHFLGVASGSLPPGGRRALARADVVCALGTDFDGLATGDWTYEVGERLVHVTLDPDDLDQGYEADVGIVADAAEAASAIRERLADRSSDGAGDGVDASDRWDGAEVGRAVRAEYRDHLANEGLFEATDEGFHTAGVLRTVRETTPDDAIVTVDVGGFRLWAMQAFAAFEPDELVAAGSWAGMGVGLPAAIGAKVARPDRPVVCLSGDGGLLMCVHELATVVQEDLDVTLVVSNNSDYAIISKQLQETDEAAFAWDSPDFPAVAEGFGWDATAVDDRARLEAALRDALDSDAPTLVDVTTPTEEPSAAAAADFETDLSF
ncbi:MAG: thiamine pyrophosphate-binding protein [Haloarculaceae archaeon]